MNTDKWKREILTVPNLLSIFRLVLIPVYVRIYLRAATPAGYHLAGAVLMLSCATDFLDGRIARRHHTVTTLGMVLDPIADKATQLTLLICLTSRYPILGQLLGLAVLKEATQLLASISCYVRKKKILNGALLSGKISTTLLFVSLIALVYFPQIPDPVIPLIVIVDGSALTFAFTDYLSVFLFKPELLRSVDSNK